MKTTLQGTKSSNWKEVSHRKDDLRFLRLLTPQNKKGGSVMTRILPIFICLFLIGGAALANAQEGRVADATAGVVLVREADFSNVEDYYLAYLTAERNNLVVRGKSTAGTSEWEAQNIEDYLFAYITTETQHVQAVAGQSEPTRAGSGAAIAPEDFDSFEGYLLEYITR